VTHDNVAGGGVPALVGPPYAGRSAWSSTAGPAAAVIPWRGSP